MGVMEDFDEDFTQCPLCNGYGELDCRCGGDLCVCENYGCAPCPLCFGDGEVSKTDFNIYTEKKRQHDDEMYEAWLESESLRDTK